MATEGDLFRVVWIPKNLKDTLKETLNERDKEEGIENFADMIILM